MKKLSASVVGGGMGGKLSLQALVDSPFFELTALADLRPEVGQEMTGRYPGLKTFTDYREMFAVSPTDVVCVSTYPPTHEEVTLAALKLDLKGILVEKPLGHTAESAQRLFKAVRARNLPLAVPHGLIAKRTPLEILRRVHAGEIGKLKLLEVQCDQWDILNAGIHWMNYFVRLIQNEPIDSVMALCEGSTKTYRDGLQVETTAITCVQTRSGVRAVMNTGDHVAVNTEGKDTVFRLVGSEGLIEFWGWENGYRLLNAEHPGGDLLVPEEEPVTGHRFHLEALARNITEGKADYGVAESSLTALEICEAAYLSSRTQTKVRFPYRPSAPVPETDWLMGVPYSGIGGETDGRKLGVR
jgi:predicted dehydrogenase